MTFLSLSIHSQRTHPHQKLAFDKEAVALQVGDEDGVFLSKDAGLHRFLLLALLEAQTLGSLGSESVSDRPLPAKAKVCTLSHPLVHTLPN